MTLRSCLNVLTLTMIQNNTGDTCTTTVRSIIMLRQKHAAQVPQIHFPFQSCFTFTKIEQFL